MDVFLAPAARLSRFIGAGDFSGPPYSAIPLAGRRRRAPTWQLTLARSHRSLAPRSKWNPIHRTPEASMKLKVCFLVLSVLLASALFAQENVPELAFDSVPD